MKVSESETSESQTNWEDFEVRQVALKCATQAGLGPRGLPLISVFEHYLRTGELNLDDLGIPVARMRPGGPVQAPDTRVDTQ